MDEYNKEIQLISLNAYSQIGGSCKIYTSTFHIEMR